MQPIDKAKRGGMGHSAAPLILIAAVWLLATLLIEPFGNFPANDDWVYGLSVEALLRTGRFSMPSPASANVVLQTYWGALFCLPFGFSYDALRVSTVVLGLVGLFAFFGAVREVGGSRTTALLTALALALNPMFLQLGNTFMTDVPFVALTSIALWQFARWARTDEPRSLIAALAIALATIFVRQFALVFVAGFGVAYVVRSRFFAASIAVLLVTTGMGVAAHLGFQHWLIATGRTYAVVGTSVHEIIPSLGLRSLKRVVANLVLLLPYVGLVAAPAYLAAGLGPLWTQARARRRWLLTAVAVLIATEVLVTRGLHLTMPYLWNSLTRAGLGPWTLRDSYLLGRNMPPVPAVAAFVWPAIMIVGMGFGAIIAIDSATSVWIIGVALRRDRLTPGDRLAAGAVATAGLYYGLLAVMGLAVGWFDRYLLVLALPLTLLIVSRASPAAGAWRSRWLAACVVAGSALFGIAAAHDYFAWQRGRLAATNMLEAHGVARTAIDGGYEYNGRYLYRARYRKTPAKSYWWVVDDRWIIASGPLPGYAVVARYGFTSWVTFGPRTVVVLRRKS